MLGAVSGTPSQEFDCVKHNNTLINWPRNSFVLMSRRRAHAIFHNFYKYTHAHIHTKISPRRYACVCGNLKMLPPTNSAWMDRATHANILHSKYFIELMCGCGETGRHVCMYMGIDGYICTRSGPPISNLQSNKPI